MTGCPDGITAQVADSLLDDADHVDADGRGGDCEILLAAQAVRLYRSDRDIAEHECATSCMRSGTRSGSGSRTRRPV